MSLISVYSEWDLELPNPQEYYESDQFWVERVNGVFVNAAKYVLCHEFAHVELQHFERIAKGENTDADRKKIENEADLRAIDLILLGVSDQNSATVRLGVLTGLCSLIFFSSQTTSQNYPSNEDRIHNILEKVNPDSEDGMWGIATLAFRLWDNSFSKMLDWKQDLKSYKELYYYVRGQIKSN